MTPKYQKKRKWEVVRFVKKGKVICCSIVYLPSLKCSTSSTEYFPKLLAQSWAWSKLMSISWNGLSAKCLDEVVNRGWIWKASELDTNAKNNVPVLLFIIVVGCWAAICSLLVYDRRLLWLCWNILLWNNSRKQASFVSDRSVQEARFRINQWHNRQQRFYDVIEHNQSITTSERKVCVNNKVSQKIIMRSLWPSRAPRILFVHDRPITSDYRFSRFSTNKIMNTTEF